MTISNKLTLTRIIISPIFLFFLLAEYIPHHFIISLIVFIIASVTDLMDGKLARKRNEITTFGKFLDPLADKILVSCALVGMVELSLFSSWFAIIILTREFLVTSVRLVAADRGRVIPANYWGKVKTVTQIVAIIAILVFNEGIYILNTYFASAVKPYMDTICTGVAIADFVLIFISTAATVISGIIYIKENSDVIADTGKTK